MVQEKENRMAIEPVRQLMMKIGLPIVLSMMLQAVYNIVDSAYLSNMAQHGEDALTALGLAFPIQLLMVAVAIGTGVGTNALLSKSLGEAKQEKVNYVAGNAICMGFIISVLFLGVGLFGVDGYVNSQNASGNISEIVIEMCKDYLRICCGISFGIVFFSIYEKILQATGRSLYSTIAQVVGAIVNIVLDPIMIYGWLGCPSLGVSGAAYATVIGQIASAILVFLFHMKLDVEIDKDMKYLRLQTKIVKEIYRIGLPAIISQALLTVMTYGLNIIFSQIYLVGQNVVTVYGLYCKIQQLIIFAAVGMRDAITPIVSFNYGMRNKTRMQEGIRYGMVYTIALMILGLIVIEVGAVPLTNFFSLSDTTYQMCLDCMRIVSLGFVFAGICIAFQGVFQAIGCGIESLVISLGRQVVFILPVAWIFVKYVNVGNEVSFVWWTFLVGETLTLLVTIWMYKRASKRKIESLEV